MKVVLSFLTIIFISNKILSQTTEIPDTNFEQALIDLGYDTTLDGQIHTENIIWITFLNVSHKSINDLAGIEDFTALTSIDCSFNQLTSLDVSNNNALTELFCILNQLTSLDVSNNIDLEILDCHENQLTNLNVSNNTKLVYINCSFNHLISLDVKNGNNSNFDEFYALGNPDLSCIQVDDPAWSTTNWEFVDATTTFSTDCNYTALNSDFIKYDFSKLIIYPNPTQGDMTIYVGETKTYLKATLINSSGQLVFSKNIKSIDHLNISINVPIGHYILLLQTELMEYELIKIVKE